MQNDASVAYLSVEANLEYLQSNLTAMIKKHLNSLRRRFVVFHKKRQIA